MTDVHVVLPHGIDDAARPSGGNVYDRQLCLGLTAVGWTVHEQQLTGTWPNAEPDARSAVAEAIGPAPDAALVVIDGLIASAVPEVLVPEAGRLRLVVLVHMPLGTVTSDADVRDRERKALHAASGIVTTSEWARRWLIQTYSLPPAVVHAVEPGVRPADVSAGTPSGGELLCVAAVTRGKGQDVLIAALETLTDLSWRCVCVGSTDVAPEFAAKQRASAEERGLGGRVRFTGPLVGDELDRAYRSADVLVLPSRAETYAMVVTEALARGLPVIATDVGGVPEAVGEEVGAGRPGLL